jgi:2-oxoisovalerate dehydrogenase E1 component
MLSPNLFKQIFFDDPLLFEEIAKALSLRDFALEQMKPSVQNIAKLTGLSEKEIDFQFEQLLNRKIWLTRAVKGMAEIKASIDHSEKKSLLVGMLLTRAVDNALKQFFLSQDLKYLGKGFPGKGFRSLGQEAIYGACLRLKHGSQFLDNGVYKGDIAAPLIRDLGVFLAMSGHDILTAINTQAGKVGLPSDGRDFHVGDFSKGLLMPAAPLAIATCTIIGLALAIKKKQEARVALSFIGEGGSSLGEWHEAINFASVHRLPMIFCIENNQAALSTPVSQQSRARRFADKAYGYGINALTIDGNDVEEVAAAFAFAAQEARAGDGPILLELNTMRMCGHAHHDDMLYLGIEPKLGFTIPEAKSGGYVDRSLFEKWRAQDPIKRYEEQLIEEQIISKQAIDDLKQATLNQVISAIHQIKKRPWPQFHKNDEALVFKAPWVFIKKPKSLPPSFSKTGATYLQGICEATRRIFHMKKNSLMIGEDVGFPYGNAFMMFKEIIHEYQDRFINAPISENAIVGACVGLSMEGFLPIGEMQFNDFVACAMDQVVNNVAKTYFRSNQNLPLVLRMPYGGLRRAGPYHSQDTSPWFYRTPGLKIMAPSTPVDAMLMLIKAVLDPDPVLFYEHIALYREPAIKQELPKLITADIEGAQLMLAGDDLTIIAYGAYVHKALAVAKKLLQNNKKAEVIDLRYLMPIDFDVLYASIKKTSRALLIGEDIRTGGILESIASQISQKLFCFLDAPVTVLGSREMPVPYAPSLEDEYLLSEENIIDEAIKLLAF